MRTIICHFYEGFKNDVTVFHTPCNTELFHNPYWIVITQFDDNEDGYCVTDEGEPVGYLEMLSSGLVYSFGSSLTYNSQFTIVLGIIFQFLCTVLHWYFCILLFFPFCFNTIDV